MQRSASSPVTRLLFVIRHSSLVISPARLLFVIRHSSFVILLATLLTACTFSTDTVATVGPEQITRGELVAVAGSSAADQAGALDGLVYGRLIALAARAHGITVTPAEIDAQRGKDLATAQGTDSFAAFLTQNYPSAASYQQNTRQQLLIEKLHPYWAKATVQAVTLQLLATDTQQKAQEAVQKGRAGASFDDLLKQYAPAAAQTPDVVNSQGSIAVDALSPTVRARFGTIQAGAWSDPLPSNGQYLVLYIAKVEQRPPTARDENGLVATWLDSLRDTYPVTITDPTIRAAAQ